MNSTMPWDSCSTARTCPSGTQRKPCRVRPDTVEGRVKSMNRLMERAPFLRYSALSLRRQALQMQ